MESGAVYGYRKVSDDLRDLGERCGSNRVHRIMRTAGLRSQTGYGKRKWQGGGAPSVVAPNHLQRQFDVLEPNKVWLTDIPTFEPMKAGCTWQLCSTCFRARSSADR